MVMIPSIPGLAGSLVSSGAACQTTLIRESDLPLMVDADLSPQPLRVSLISPDYPEVIELPFSLKDGYLCFVVPRLRVWDIIVIE